MVGRFHCFRENDASLPGAQAGQNYFQNIPSNVWEERSRSMEVLARDTESI